jgi:hypothetical protein
MIWHVTKCDDKKKRMKMDIKANDDDLCDLNDEDDDFKMADEMIPKGIKV